jgi:hypothetical protein
MQKCIQSSFISLRTLLVSTQFESSEFKVSSVNYIFLCKINISKQTIYTQWTGYTLPSWRGGGWAQWGNNRPKQDQSPAGQTPNSLSPCLMPRGLFRSLTPFSFVDCNTLLSLGLIPLPVSSFPRQVPHDSSMPNIWGSPRRSRIASVQGHAWHTWWLSLATEGDSIMPFWYTSL